MGSIEGIRKIVVTRDLGPHVMPVLQERKDFNLVVCPEDTKDRQAWIKENVPGAEGLLCMLADKVSGDFCFCHDITKTNLLLQITQEIIETAGPTLKVVSTMSVGYEHVHLPTLVKSNVRLGYTPDVLTNAVADLAIMLALMASRNAREAMTVVNEGNWPNSPWSPFGFCGPQLSTIPHETSPGKSYPGKTVGFLGFGRIAHATLARLIPFGIRNFIYTGNPASSGGPSAASIARDAALAASLGLPASAIARVPLETLAADADVLFVLAPGGAGTHHAVDAAFLARMKRTAVLVNPSRGTIVDSDALAAALRAGALWGAGLDVVEGEPHVGADHPLVREPRCVVLPHIGSATTETRIGIGRLAAFNVIGGVMGEEMPSELDLAGRG
ncbi:hypothetical protein DFH11DRAFT_1800585 [Phellopilus nigrolimitatus]|nr:hypothetical protein DFH11DRAFT_1800585 [Phellopilus nigrolimitatus]